jgi:MFS family permease
MRVLTAYALFILAEYVLWIAVIVYAYDQGGATAAGLVVVAQLLPAAVVAPLVAPLADRRSPAALLAVGYAVQGVAATATAVLLLVDAPSYLVYLGAIAVSVAITTTRPAQAALLPSVTRVVSELTAANAVIGWAESVSIMLAGAASGVILVFGTVGHVCAFGAAMLLTAMLLVVPLRRGTVPPVVEGEAAPVGGGFSTFRHEPAVRLLVGLLGAQYVVIGALDVLFVVIALDLLGQGEPWVGYLNMAYGAGGVVLGALAALLVGRRLGPVIVVTAVLLGVPLALTAFTVVPGVVVVLLVAVGGSRTLFDVGTRTLLQRAVPADQIARVFGVAEGLMMAGIALGATIVPVLVSLGGGELALVGVAVLLPAIVALRTRRLVRLDQHAQVPVVEIALLRSLHLFRLLPPPAVEGLAKALEPRRFDPGNALVREGEDGDCYYAIAEGEVEILRSGRRVGTLRRGDGLGEIALLRTGRRTATAVAASPVLAYRLDRGPFLVAVTRHLPTLESALAGIRETQARDARRDGGTAGSS